MRLVFTISALILVPLMTFSQKVGIGTDTPTQILDVDGKLRIGNDGATPFPGTMRYWSADSVLQVYDGLNWRSATSQWSEVSNRLYYNNGAVLVGRTNTIGSERFGIRYLVSSATYGGMYVETNGHTGSKPFYGYAIDNSPKMWHYYDGATSSWRLYNAGERLVVLNTGEIGIGTLTPQNRLDVRSDGVLNTPEIVLGLISNASNNPVLQFSRLDVASPTSGMSIEYNGNTNRMHIRGTDAERKITIMSGGDMGLGVEFVNEQLEVGGDGRVFIGDGNGATRKGLLIDAVEVGEYVRMIPYNYGSASFMNMYFPSTVSIGINTPASGYLLSVNGKIMAEELKVQMSESWPDYVFSEDYELRSIDELRQFIEFNNHLPGVPSARSIESENGFEIGEMQRVLVEKIEELTLYILKQDEVISGLQEQINRLK